jgi:N-acetyl-anhydromuramyl-L-alanine amidase AmpD
MASSNVAAESTIKDGKLVSDKVIDKINSKIEKGGMSVVNAIVVHQTGSSTAESTLNGYKTGGNGAHFLIGKDGTIYQTARMDKQCWHVGKIPSKCYNMKTCSEEELKSITAILFKKGESYSVRVKNLHDHEEAKSYPDRFPMNSDSIGIELVGSFLTKKKEYETVTDAQNTSLAWLVGELQRHLSLDADDVYRHPDVSYKQASEAKSASW